MRKPLIVYYSRKGENYWDGQIRSLPKGNTEVVAEMIADMTGGDLFEIDTVQPYAAGYRDCVQQAVAEFRQNARPALKAYPDSLDGYDVIFCGLSQLVRHHAHGHVHLFGAFRSDGQTHLALLHQRRQRHGAQRTRSEPGLHGGHCGTRPFHPWVPGGQDPATRWRTGSNICCEPIFLPRKKQQLKIDRNFTALAV